MVPCYSYHGSGNSVTRGAMAIAVHAGVALLSLAVRLPLRRAPPILATAAEPSNWHVTVPRSYGDAAEQAARSTLAAARDGGRRLLVENAAIELSPGSEYYQPSELIGIVHRLALALLEAGMTTARFDFSWGSMEYHTRTLNNLREAMKQTKILCATMLDTRGPEIGVQLAPQDVSSFDSRAPKVLALEQGNRVTLTTDVSVPASSEFLPVNNPDLVHFVEAGDDGFVGQYLFTGSETSSVYLKVDEVDAKAGHIYCTCKNTARLGGVLLTVQVSNKGDDLPTLSEWDRHVIEHWAVPNQIDFISLSFTSNVQAVHECREFVRSVGGGGVSIVAKVERLSALTHIDAIVDASDGIILSRGNLGLDMPPEKVFLSQKMVLHKCNSAGKPAVITRVVDTMTETPMPTRRAS